MNGLRVEVAQLGWVAMRKFQSVLLASAAFFALASTAQASDLTRDFSGVKSGSVTVPALVTESNPTGREKIDVGPNAQGQIKGKVDLNNDGNGGFVEAKVDLNSNLVTFESGTAAAGNGYVSNSLSGIDIGFANGGDGTIGLNPFSSTIIPAGMGFYVQDRSGLPAGGNPFTGYGQSVSVGFEDFYDGVDRTVAQAEFDFDVLNGGSVLYSLRGITSLNLSSSGWNVSNALSGEVGGSPFAFANFSTATDYLNGFRTAKSDHHAVVYDWQATNILIPLDPNSLDGRVGGYSTRTITYRANVTSWTTAGCINNNCIVAFAGFGDPVGRGGGDVEPESLFGDASPLHVDDDYGIITGLNFRPVEVNVAAIPEPSTWALMIGGFGLAGAALRRRRRVAYT